MDGRLIASTVEPPFPMVTPAEMARLRSEGRLRLANGQHANLVIENGVPIGVGLSLERPPPLDRTLAPLFTFLLCLLVAAIFFARHLAKPLQSIANAADRFGRGELSARTNVRRNDEIGVAAHAFDEMADRVTGLMRTQQELLANVSHELRTPLSRIHVAVDLLIDGVSDQAKELLPEIAHDLGELERLVDDVLEVARLDLSRSRNKTAGTPLRMETVSPADLLHKAAARFRSHHQSHQLVVETAPSLPSLSADAVLLRRVIDNLVDNARKYSEPGTVIRATAAATAGGVRIAVTDSGIGMEESDLKQVFTPFFRSDRSRSRATGGVGLGLVLARRIVEAHDGKIAITSTPGCGTTVTLDLPAQPL
jgi:signal transduction histidine kinase